MITKEQIVAFTTAADIMIEAHRQKNFPNVPASPPLEISMGKAYARITKKNYPDDKHGSTWVFIDLSNGDILKPAGWKTPAKHSRGNILTPTFGVEFVGPHGAAYLR